MTALATVNALNEMDWEQLAHSLGPHIADDDGRLDDDTQRLIVQTCWLPCT